MNRDDKNDKTNERSECRATFPSEPEPCFCLDDPKYDFLDDVFPIEPPHWKPTREELEEYEAIPTDRLPSEPPGWAAATRAAVTGPGKDRKRRG